MSQSKPIRQGLTINILAIVLLLSSAITISMFLATKTAVRSLAHVVMEQTFIQSENAIFDFVSPVEHELKMTAARARTGLLKIDQPEKFKELFSAFLQLSNIATSALLTDGNQNHWLLIKQENRVVLKSIKTEEIAHFLKKIKDPVVVQQLEKMEIAWFPRHHLIDPGKSTTSALIKFLGNDNKEMVLTINLNMLSIDQHIEDIRPLGSGHAIVVIPDKHVIGLPKEFLTQEKNKVDEFPILSQWPLGSEILNAAKKQSGKNTMSRKTTPLISRKLNNTKWWISGRALLNDSANQFHIIVMLPEHVLVDKFRQQHLWILGFTLLALFLGIVHVRRLARRYSQPLVALVEQSRRISQGDLKVPEEIETSVLEVKQLVQAHSHMRTGLTSLMKLERDLQLARQIQQSSMPHKLPRLSSFDIAAWNSPADATGGDTFDVVGLKTEKSGMVSITTHQAEKAILLLADATGHGMGPALSVTQLRAMLRMGCHITPEIAQWVRHINRQLYHDLPDGRFITAWMGEIDNRSKKLTYFSAGQGPLFHFRRKISKLLSFSADTVPLGIMMDMDIAVNQIDMEHGDIFVVISDGIFEACNQNKEQMGEERIKQVIIQNHSDPARNILKKIQQITQDFTKGLPADDDRTILIVKRI